MKFSKLLVLSALWLVGLSASAEIVDGVRQRPNVSQTETFAADQVFYMFNTQARMFFLGANDWNTRASVGEKGYKVKFVTNETATALGDGVYELTDSVETQKTWKSTFATADAAGIWVDNSTEANRFWKVNPQTGNEFRLSNATLDEAGVTTGKFLGKAPGSDTRLYFLAADSIGACLEWVLVSEATYTAYQETWAAMKDQFNAAAELLTYIKLGEEKGIDVSEQKKVYANEAATVDEINAAIESIKVAINALVLKGATAENPADGTSLLLNPNFDNASAEGWKGTAPNMAGDGNHAAANVAEHYNKTFDTYQTLSSLPKGVYRVSAKTLFRGTYEDLVNGTNKVAYLYASTGTAEAPDSLITYFNNAYSPLNSESLVTKYGATTYFGTPNAEGTATAGDVTYYAPNNPSTFRLYYEEEGKNWYDTKVFFEITDNGTVTLGVKKDKNVTSTDWAIFDTFGLKYYGAETAAFQVWIKEAAAILDVKLADGAVFTQSYLDALETAKASATATSKEEVIAALATIQTAADSLTANVNLWNQYVAKVNEGREILAEAPTGVSAYDDLGDYIDMEYEEIISAHDLNNDGIRAEIANVEALIEATFTAIAPGTDVTSRFVKDADFTSGKGSWIQGKGGCNFREKIAEAYDTDFDLYQEVVGVPKGVYELQLQGFFRMERDDAAYQKYIAGEQKTEAGVYINNNKTQLMCVYAKGLVPGVDDELIATKSSGWWENTNVDGTWYPNDMTSAANAFNFTDEENNRYWYVNKAYGLVTEDGASLRIGVGGNVKGPNWICFDNFRLIYQGYSPDVVAPVLQNALDNLPSTDEMMTKTTFEKFNKAVADAKAALAGTDGEAMFKALIAIYGLTEEVNNSVAACKALNTKAEALIADAGAAVNPAAQSEAYALAQTIQDGLTNKAFEDADIAAYEIKIKAMHTKLMLDPNYATATEAAPVDVTKVIYTPNFEKDGANSVEGWTAEGYNFGNDDTQKSALLLEYYDKKFDIYQDIYGMPAGYYTVGVSAFCRIGSIAQDFAAFAAKADSTEAYVYVQNDSTVSGLAPVSCLAKGAVTEDPGISGTDTLIVDGVKYYFPNDMVSAGSFFTNGAYANALTFQVNEGAVLRIGMKKEVNTSSGWAILDNWTLKYLGTTTPTGIKSVKGESTAKTVRVEFFSLDGRRVNAAFKGIAIQKLTKEDGSVIVRKVRK